MKKEHTIKIKKSTIWWTIGIIIFLAWLFWPISEDLYEPLDYNSQNNLLNQNITFYFYDNNSECELNGKVYIDNIFVGNSKKGIYNLSEENYLDLWSNGKIKIKGNTDDCFKENKNLPFIRYWDISNLDYYLENSEVVEFIDDFNPRWPEYPQEMQGFIRPNEAQEYLNSDLRKYFKENIEDNLDIINGFGIRYRSDSLLFDTAEYWQTPLEAIEKGHGDCEDWAVTTLSLMRAYNPSLECYNALWETHLSVLCFINNSIIFYDQGDTKFESNINFNSLTESEKKYKIRSVRNNYLDYWGIPPEETGLLAIFNEKDLITFEEPEDFVNWVVNKD
jgi:hypothetical protein